MTALSGPIVFNNSGSGSDSAASGCGPATAVTTQAMFSSGSAGITVSSSTGMSVGDLIYVPANTGRKFNVIASISGTIITCDDNWDDSQMGTAIYVGGKRATLDNTDSRRVVTTDNPATQWTVELENTGTDYAITSTLSLKSVTIQGNDESNPTGVTFNQNGRLFDAANGTSTIRNLNLKCTAASKSSATAINKAAFNSGFDVHNVTFDATDNWNKAFGSTATAPGGLRVSDSKIYNTITNISNFDNIQQFYNCIFKDCSGNGISSASNTCIVKGCIFDGCSGGLIYQVGNPGSHWIIQGNIFNGGSVGLDFYTYTYQMAIIGAFDNIFSGFTSNAIANRSTDTGFQIFRNAFYNNAADYNGTHEGNITLTADPFVDAANGDFNLNADAGGGATLRANNYAINTDTSVYPFRQYVSDDFDSGAGGGATVHPLRGTQ